ncbi:hypothetical protein ACFVUH_35975 [Kitasatospora sp. NPDC058032]|uniref:hypothetical protein n=1 Tax=Kitasatospora sp. NPDC058032 TaxID=3346307 RepID=UPI0036DA8317
MHGFDEGVEFSLEWEELPEPAASARGRYEDCLEHHPECPHAPHCREPYEAAVGEYRMVLDGHQLGVCREGMRRTGMSYPAEEPEFPDWPFATTAEWYAAPQDVRDAHKAADRAARVYRVPGMAGIPEFKVRESGPWSVGPEEIGEALGRYEAAPAGVRAELEGGGVVWPLWLDWLRDPAGRGGFRVD